MPEPPLARACVQLGVDAHGAQLLHLRANAVYFLPRQNLVLRLRHAPDHAMLRERLEAAIRTTRWLAVQGFATITPLAIPQPVRVGEWLATAWHHVPHQDTDVPQPEDLATLLRQLHTLPRPPHPPPGLNYLGSLRQDLKSQYLTPQQRSWLHSRCDSIEAEIANLALPGDRVLLHGDAHNGNLLGRHGHWLLGDWDSLAYGPRIQDLVPQMMAHRRFGQLCAHWRRFCRVYGIDPDIELTPPAQVLIAARELRSLAAYLRASDQATVRAELQRRLATLIDDKNITWTPI